MRSLLAVAGLALALGARPPAGAAEPGLHLGGRRPLEPGAVAGVTHPCEPMFRTGDDGWPIQGDSGYVALRDRGRGFVYSTAQLDGWRGGAPSPDRGRENWGQIETFACVSRALRELERRVPGHAPIPIGHVSGEHGGFPDLIGAGYSGHLSHQTGLHFNFRLPPLEGVHERVYAMPGEPRRFDEELFLTLLDALRHHGAHTFVTNREVVDLASARDARFPSLSATTGDSGPTPDGTWYALRGGGALILFDAPGNHADHCNTVFWPGR